MSPRQYGLVADAYRRIAGENLVAAEDYVTPMWEATEVAVSCDPALDSDSATETRSDFENEVAERVAAMIAVQTYGAHALSEEWIG